MPLRVPLDGVQEVQEAIPQVGQVEFEEDLRSRVSVDEGSRKVAQVTFFRKE
jgi:hypothetical protein